MYLNIVIYRALPDIRKLNYSGLSNGSGSGFSNGSGSGLSNGSGSGLSNGLYS